MRDAAEENSRNARGAPYIGHTTWQSHWSYASSAVTALGCQAQSPSVELTIHYLMPRLASDSGVAPEDLLEWRRHAISLWRHEEGHALRAVRGAAEMRDSLSRLRADDCTALRSSIPGAMDAVLFKYKALRDRYDAQTPTVPGRAPC
jgi:Predicted secreted Zn-dependent protease